MIDSTHLKRMAAGIQCYNKKHFWECHEELEEIWLEDRGDNARYLYWAIIQVAASMVHVREKNLIGASGMIGKAQKKLHQCREFYLINKLVEEELSWSVFEKLVHMIKPSDPLSSYQQLYDFKFSNFSFGGSHE